MDLFLVCAVLLVALVFTYTNGFHDTANAIATVVGTKVLTPRQAIMLAALTNLFGAFFGLAVAKTISSGLVDARFVTQEVLICGLVAAIFWNLLTWWFGMPSSSSHALVGSLVGAALAGAVCVNAVQPLTDKDGRPLSVWTSIKWKEVKTKKEKTLAPATPEVVAALGAGIKTNGTHTVRLGSNQVQVVAFCGRVKTVQVVDKLKGDKSGLYYKVIIPMVSSPLMGFFVGLILMGSLYAVLRSWKPVTVNRVFGRLQLASSAYMGFSHGMNDATKCMGIITLALVAATTKGLFAGVPAWASWIITREGSDPFALSLGDTLVSWLPGWLQFGYMPSPADVKSQGIPSWVVVLCALTMAAGTAAGGWRIIKTLGHKVVKLQPVHGFAAETTAASVLAVAASLGMPISTTHAITTSIMGVGCAKRFSALKLRVVERIIWAWIMTLPITAGVAFGLVWLGNKIGWVKL
ncbi:MAG TPA: inorganic phosphate transporter [Candidatus Binatia bacterium]|nr:inorganic phosphate transporter [Candidatus Binatia bacterium]